MFALSGAKEATGLAFKVVETEIFLTGLKTNFDRIVLEVIITGSSGLVVKASEGALSKEVGGCFFAGSGRCIRAGFCWKINYNRLLTTGFGSV